MFRSGFCFELEILHCLHIKKIFVRRFLRLIPLIDPFQRLITIDYANYRKEQYDAYFRDASIESYQNEDVKRQLMLLKNIGTSALSDDDLNLLTRTRTDMSGIYNSARICPYNNRQCNLATEGLTLDPDIEERFSTLASTGGNYEELQYLWVSIAG